MNVQQQILEAIKQANQILITSHKSPDGDSIGSSLALQAICHKLGKKVQICHPDPAPQFLQWLENVQTIYNVEQHANEVQQSIDASDLHIVLDYNDPSRTGPAMQQMLEGKKLKTIVIDHHLDPSNFADLLFSDTNSCSTCQMIYVLMTESGIIELLDEHIGTPMYLGIMTDSGSFRFPSVKAITHQIAAHLIEVGVKHHTIHEQVFDNNNLERIRLRSYLCAERLEYLEQHKTAYISFSLKDQANHPFEKGDTEGLVNVALSINGVMKAAFFMETEDGVKISFRSKGENNPVNGLANKYFDGGGHANAAGGFYKGNLEEALQLFKKTLPEYEV